MWVCSRCPKQASDNSRAGKTQKDIGAHRNTRNMQKHTEQNIFLSIVPRQVRRARGVLQDTTLQAHSSTHKNIQTQPETNRTTQQRDTTTHRNTQEHARTHCKHRNTQEHTQTHKNTQKTIEQHCSVCFCMFLYVPVCLCVCVCVLLCVLVFAMCSNMLLCGSVRFWLFLYVSVCG